MLDAADILVDVHPVADILGNGWRRCMRRREPGEIPGRIHERVHRVRLALGRPAAAGARHFAPGIMAIQRVARPVKAHVIGQSHRQIRLRHRHRTAVRAMDNRDRRAPVSLPRDAPVAQPEVDATLALSSRLQPPGDLVLGIVDRHAVDETRVDDPSRPDIGLVTDRKLFGRRVLRTHHRHHVQPVLPRKVQVALVMRRDSQRSRRCRSPSG